MKRAQITYIESTGLINVTLLDENGVSAWSQDNDQFQVQVIFNWCANWVKHGLLPLN